MPKERSHWHLAVRLAEKLGPGPMSDAVLGYPEFLLAGAVAHDSGYYQLGDAQAKSAADRLHGCDGQDSFTPFRALAAQSAVLGPEGLAFGLGALTHLAADATFHPLVFSWTGDPKAADPALRTGWLYRHQGCETALDQHLEALWGRAPAKTLWSVCRQAGEALPTIHSIFSGAESRPWLRAHSRLQTLFHRPWARWLALIVSRSQRAGDGDWSAAFYRGPSVRHPAFDDDLTWVDPVTGTARKASLGQLVSQFETLAWELAAEWESCWSSGRVPFLDRVGPSLDTGLPSDQVQLKQHFATKWF